MAEQKLDVKVTESGTAVVTSQIDKLTAQLTGIEKAQEKETAATEKATAATERQASALEGLLKKTEGKFAIFDRIAGVMGKVNLALELVNKAYEWGKKVVEDYILKMQSLAPALEVVNGKLRDQLDIYKKIGDARAKSAGAAGVSIAGLTTAEGQRFEGLTAEEELLKNAAATDVARAQYITNNRRQLDPADSAYQRVIELGDKEIAEIDARNAAREERIKAIAAERKRLEADIATRGQPFDTFGPEAAGDAGRGGRGGGGAKEDDILANLPELRSEMLRRLGLGPDEKKAGGPGGGAGVLGESVDEIAAAFGKIAPIQAYSEELRNVAEAYASAAQQASDFAEATGKAALASAVAAAFAGKSVLAAVADVLKARAQEATVEALWAFGKGLFYSFTDPELAGPYFAAAGYFGATAAAAGIGSAVLGGGGSGGGGSSGGGAPSNADFGPRRERDEGGGTTIVNVYNDGLTLSTEQDIGRAVAGSLQAVARSPGSREGAIQINTGGSRRR